ncbi:HVO_A0114 family putative DNA-binding protein [Azospirillum sp. sgz301742]
MAAKLASHSRTESWETLTKTLTGKRLDLLRYLHRRPATGVADLARALGRDYERVSEDVEALAEVGLIDRTEDGVHADYDEIRTTIAL